MSAAATTRPEKVRPTARWSYFPRLIRLLFTFDRRRFVLLVLLQIVSGVMVTLGVYLLERMIDGAQAVVTAGAPLTTGLGWAAALAGFYIARGGVGSLTGLIADRFQEMLRGHIEETAYMKAQTLSLERLETPEYHDQLQRVRRGMDRRFFSTMAFLWRSLGDLIALASLLVYLGGFHWALPLLVVIGLTPGVLITERVHRARYLVERKQTPEERRFRAYVGLLTGRHAAAEVRMFGFGGWLIEQTASLWSRLSRERLALAGREARATLLADGLNALVYVVAIAFSLGLLLTGRVAIGAYAAFFYAVESFQRHYWGLVWNISIIHSDLRYVKDYFDFMDHEGVDVEKGVRLPGPVREGIAFRNVSFTYPGSDRPALVDINLTIRTGERVALVGENGAGKSTLVKLLMGLYTPTRGSIEVDGVDLREIAPADWYRRIGAVFQDFNRYEASVRDNIAFGWVDGANRPGAIEQAAARSGALEFVAELPDGLETHLGKTYREGRELSVGQWQKLAIARATLRPAEILILDEPASALDAKAEAEVYEQFATLAAGRTAVLISHRLGSCRMADRILVLQDGRLVEEGTHDELIAQGGEYAAMYRAQAAWYR
jgi:ATP-binding cassette subfamily B protein